MSLQQLKADTVMTYLRQAKWWQISLIVIGAIVGLIACVWLLATYWPGGVDFYSQYYPIPNKWLRGEIQLYDEQSGGYYLPPWATWVLLLFTIWPYDIARALLWIASTTIIIYGVFVFCKPGRHRPWALAFALFNLFTFDLQYRSQIDALSTLGFILGWVALCKRKPWLLALAYIMLTVKVPNTIPAALFFLGLSLKHWPRRDFLTSLILPVTIAVSSLFIFPGWIPRWRTNMQAQSPLVEWETTIWRIADVLQLPSLVTWSFVVLTLSIAIWAWVRAKRFEAETQSPQFPNNITLAQFMIVITTTFIITPYSASYHFIPLLAVVLPILAGWRLSVVVGLYLLTYLPLSRLFLGHSYAWIDFGFVLAIFVATIVYVVDISQKDNQGVQATTSP